MITVSKSTYISYCDSSNKAIFQAKSSCYERRFSCSSNVSKETSKQNNKVIKPNKPKNEVMLCYSSHIRNTYY